MIKKVTEAKKIASESAKPLPKRIGFKKDGIRRYRAEDIDIAVIKSGDTYRIYDYETGDVSRAFNSTSEMNKVLREARSAAAMARGITNETSANFNDNAKIAENTNEILSSVNENTNEKTVNSEEKKKFSLETNVNSYTEQEIESITRDSKNKIANSYADVIEFISASLDNKTNGRLFIGKIKTSTAAKIKELTKISAFGKSLVLTSDEIKHIFKQHGNPQTENARGQEAITTNNFDAVLEAICAPSNVISEIDENGVVSLIFSKEVNGETTAVTIVSEKKKALTLKSARINKKGQRISPPSDVRAPNPTPKSEWSMNTIPKDSIPDLAGKVNRNSEKSSENSSGTERKTERAKEAERADKLLREKVKGYNEISAPAQTMIRKVLRDAKRAGLSETEALTYARVATHSGLNIVFSKRLCAVHGEDGSVTYADGRYDHSQNRIIINPEGSRSIHDVMIHELDHAIRKGSKGRTTVYMREVFKHLSESERNKIIGAYKGVKTDNKILLYGDEFNAYFAEKVLKNRDLQKVLFDNKPSVAKKIVDFFRGASEAYSDDPKLSRVAKWYEKRYRKMFEDFAAGNAGRNAVERVGESGETRFALIGRTEDGRGIYRSNYPKNTPKAQKQKDIIDLVQNVWSEKPIKLDLVVNGQIIPIEANFNPELTERSDLSKIAFGNRKGTNSEKRITLDLSSDLYQIAEESHHVGSKIETGKDNPAHFGVSEWHYFLTNLVFVEDDGTNVDCYMNIDVKQNGDGHWFYSFAIEKGTAPRTLLAGVTDKSATVPTNSIPNPDEKVNTSDKKYLEAVKKGDMQTAQRMVDEAAKKAGYDKLFYHGAKKGGGFTEFRDWSYFTENKQYAERYADRNKKESLYTTYVKLEKPFDTRIKADRVIFNDIRQEYGLSEIQDSGLPDWTDGYDISDYIDESGLDYDGIILDEGGDMVNGKPISRGLSYVVRKSAQIKSADPVTYDNDGNIIPLSERFNPENDDIRYALPLDSENYSYENLTAKPDLNIVTLPKTVPKTETGKINNKSVIAKGRLNARSQNNNKNTNTETYVNVPDIGVDVMIGAKGLQHGLTRNDEDTALAVMKIGDILKNSVAVNELNKSETRKTSMSYVLLGACQIGTDLCVVRSIINKSDNSISEYDLYKLGAVKGKKRETLNSALKRGAAVTEQSSLISSGSRIISITDFLENVKSISLANEVFSADVAEKLGISRTKGSLTEDLRYALPLDEVFTAEELSEGEAKFDPEKVKKPINVGTVTSGEYAKRIADLSKKVRFDKSFVDSFVYYVVDDVSGNGVFKSLPPEVRDDIIRQTWEGLNRMDAPEERKAFAHEMAEYTMAQIISHSKVPRVQDENNVETFNYLSSYIGRLTFTAAERSEIRHAADRDGLKVILGRWGNKGKTGSNGKTLPPVHLDDFVTSFSREMEGFGYGYLEEENNVDALLKIDKIYGDLRDDFLNLWESAFEYATDGEIESVTSCLLMR